MGQHVTELAKALASGVSRRQALTRFVVGITGAALATVVAGLASTVAAKPRRCDEWCAQEFEGNDQERCRRAQCPKIHEGSSETPCCPTAFNGRTIVCSQILEGTGGFLFSGPTCGNGHG